MSASRSRVAVGVACALAVIGGCAGGTLPPADGSAGPSITRSQWPSVSPMVVATSSATTTPAVIHASPATAGWSSAGTMAVGRTAPHAFLLPDGRVFMVGNEPGNDIRDDSATAELWDPATNAWTPTASLNRPRTALVAAALPDGRVLVTGGLDRGPLDPGNDPAYACGATDAAAFSSTYLYDPATGRWSRAGLLGTARAAASGAVLPDGRVLVAGGYYLSRATSRTEGGIDTTLAVYRAPDSAASRLRGDIVPERFIPALATAELFDPGTATWSPTGPLHYARLGAAAVTLTDGRVLVVGSQGWTGDLDGAFSADGAASGTAEIYDPRTGRFTLTGDLPDPHPAFRTVFEAKMGWTSPGSYFPGDEFVTNGVLVALADGGALLIGNEQGWKHQASLARSFRFDGRTGQWSEVGTPTADVFNPIEWHSSGYNPLGAAVARLADGRVLIAGGSPCPGCGEAKPEARLYDPASGSWTALPSMPEPRVNATAVALPDGSALLVGGFGSDEAGAPCTGSAGSRAALRFVPAP